MRVPLLRNSPARRSTWNVPNCRTRLVWTGSAITASGDCTKSNTQPKVVQRPRPDTDCRLSSCYSRDSHSRSIPERDRLPFIDHHSKLNDCRCVRVIPEHEDEREATQAGHFQLKKNNRRTP